MNRVVHFSSNFQATQDKVLFWSTLYSLNCNKSTENVNQRKTHVNHVNFPGFTNLNDHMNNFLLKLLQMSLNQI